MKLKELTSRVNDDHIEEVSKIEFEDADLINISFVKNLYCHDEYMGWAEVTFAITDDTDYGMKIVEYDDADSTVPLWGNDTVNWAIELKDMLGLA